MGTSFASSIPLITNQWKTRRSPALGLVNPMDGRNACQQSARRPPDGEESRIWRSSWFFWITMLARGPANDMATAAEAIDAIRAEGAPRCWTLSLKESVCSMARRELARWF